MSEVSCTSWKITCAVVTQSAYISDWFKQRELALGLAMTICISRSGTVLNYLIAHKVYVSTKSLAFSFWVGTLMMGLSLLSAIATIMVDRHVQVKSGYSVKKAANAKKIQLSDIKNFSLKFWLVVSCLVGFYLAFLCFVNISAAFAIDKFGFGTDDANILAVSLILLPIVRPALGRRRHRSFHWHHDRQVRSSHHCQ